MAAAKGGPTRPNKYFNMANLPFISLIRAATELMRRILLGF